MPSRVFAAGILDGQVAMVSAGGSDVGRAAAVELAACGATVVAVGPDEEALERTGAMCEKGRCEAAACDTHDEDAVGCLVGDVLGRHERIDTLVNCIEHGRPPAATPPASHGLDSPVGWTLEAAWLLTHAVGAQAMIPAGQGKVVTVTGSATSDGSDTTHFAAGAAGVENLTRTLAIEWARFGIRLTAITAEHGRRLEELAWLIAYLASPAGDFHSGGVMTVDS
jgi:citronellol/citronellal dehydrogenase